MRTLRNSSKQPGVNSRHPHVGIRVISFFLHTVLGDQRHPVKRVWLSRMMRFNVCFRELKLMPQEDVPCQDLHHPSRCAGGNAEPISPGLITKCHSDAVLGSKYEKV